MDGTFLDASGSYDHEEFHRLIKRLRAQDISFVVASGNSMPRLRMMFGDLVNQLDFVAENGAHLLVNGKTVARHQMSKSDVTAFLDYFEGQYQELKITLTGINGTYMVKGTSFKVDTSKITPEEAEIFIHSVQEVEYLSDILMNDDIMKIFMMADLESCQRVEEQFNRQFTGNLRAITSGFDTVDFIQKGIDKGWGLEQLMVKEGIDSRQLMAFGDGGNDIEMLKLAGHSFAMANATANVKQVARAIAPSNSQNGVFRTIEVYLQEIEN